MDAATARARIEDETQWQAAPALTAPEVDRLLTRAAVVQMDDTIDYPASSVRAAIAAGWRMKAGKAAGQFDVKAGDVAADRSQIVAMCLRMAARYASVGTLTAGTALGEWR